MRLCFFNDHRLGLVQQGVVLDVTVVLESLPKASYPYPRNDVYIERLEALRPAILGAAATANRIRLADVDLLSPVLNPGKIVAAPVNYRKH